MNSRKIQEVQNDLLTIANEEIDLAYLGAQIRNLRKKHKYTQAYLAYKVCISAANLSKIENCRTDLKTSTLFAIANALDTTTDNLIKGHYVTSSLTNKSKEIIDLCYHKCGPDYQIVLENFNNHLLAISHNDASSLCMHMKNILNILTKNESI